MRVSAVLQATVAAALVGGLAVPAGASEQVHEHSLHIAIDDGTEDGMFFVEFDSGPDSIDLHGLQLGETRSMIDHNGRPILFTRTRDGIELNIDGKQIEMPQFGNAMGAALVLADDESEIDLTMARSVTIEHSDNLEGVTIISDETIDDATRSGIRALLLSSGHAGDVTFIDADHSVENPIN